MTYQVLWTRALAVVLGSSTYSFTLILVAFLLGLAGGSALAASLLPRLRPGLMVLAASRLAVALCAAPTLFFLDSLPAMVLGFLRGAAASPAVVLGFTFAVACLVVLVPATAMGTTLPAALAACPTRPHVQPQEVQPGPDPGRRMGDVYAANTVGAILGSLAGGFLVLPLLGIRRGITAAVTLDLLVAAALAAHVSRSEARAASTVNDLDPEADPRSPVRRLAAPRLAAISAALALALPLVVPRWNTSMFVWGTFRYSIVKEHYADPRQGYAVPELLFYRDGLSATVSVERSAATTFLKANGKVEASDHADMPTQITAALLPILLHPAPREAALVGLASGVTAGAALQAPLRRLTVIEIEGAMAEASRHFDHTNHRPLDDPRTVLRVTDGRNFLASTPETFDVVISEPSNPWVAGVASLFTVESFTAVLERLRPGGLFGQWLQLYEISPDSVRLVLRSFIHVFPHAVAFSSVEKGVDLFLIGSREPIRLDLPTLRRHFQDPRVAAEAARAGIRGPLDLLARLFMGEAELRRFAGTGELHTDDNCRLEFAAPLDLIRYDVHEGFFRSLYYGTRGRRPDYGGIQRHLSGFGTRDRADLAVALVERGNLAEAERLAREVLLEEARDAAGAAAARRALALVRLSHLPLDDLDAWRARLPGPFGGASGAVLRYFAEMAAGRPKAALAALAGAPESDGNDPRFAILAGYGLLRAGMPRAAAQGLRPVAEKPGPERAMACFLLARSLQEAGDYPEAVAWLDLALGDGLAL